MPSVLCTQWKEFRVSIGGCARLRAYLIASVTAITGLVVVSRESSSPTSAIPRRSRTRRSTSRYATPSGAERAAGQWRHPARPPRTDRPEIAAFGHAEQSTVLRERRSSWPSTDGW
jgi:hypothetical protein